MSLRPGELLIEDNTHNDTLFLHNGVEMGRGAEERDFSAHPHTMMAAPPSQMKVISKSEWSDRIKEKVQEKAQLSDILLRAGVPSKDQGQEGFCWAYSSTGILEAVRAKNNQRYVDLEAHSVGATIKQGRNEGGWCGLSADFILKHGVVPQDLWPRKSLDYRQHGTRTAWERAADFKPTEGFVDLARDPWDRRLTFEQIATCLLRGDPCALDFLWWKHSVMAVDLVEVEPGSFGIRIRNSWTDTWGDRGFAVLRGEKIDPAQIMGGICFAVVGAAR